MNTESETEIHDVIIIGAGPCGLGVAARIHEDTPSAVFTDEEHQRYHWIKKHTGKMNLVQAGRTKKNVRAEKWNHGITHREKNEHRQRRESSDSISSVPSLASSASSISSTSSISTLVLDGSGDGWMQRWNNAFRRLEIKQLRSPMFFHVDPGDRDGMLAYTQEMGREGDLWEISGCVGKEMSKHKKKKMRQGGKTQTIGVEIDERDRKDYFSPSTDLFADYCNSIIDRYGLDHPEQIQKQEVVDMKYDYPSDRGDEPVSDDRIFTLTTASGLKFYSRAVVLAIGAGGAELSKIFPWKPSSPEEGSNACCHSMEIKTFPSPNVRAKVQRRQETNVVVVGGGLSSAQIVDMAVRKGVTKVWFIMRSGLKIKHFDINLPWMGKYKNWEKAAFFSADTDEERLEMMKTARNGGSITPRYTRIVKQHAAHNRASIHTNTVITSHEYNSETQTWNLTTDPQIPNLPPIDYIYFATGARADVREMSLLRHMNEEYPVEVKEGLPCLTEDLMWRDDVPLYMTGRMAGLRLGPGAPNLEGARLGAERIAWSLEEVLGKAKEVGEQCEGFCGLGNRYASLVGESDE
ncbi:hypothetical protein N7490_004833 [Penicillium lividum]|nr:hypothetical protein N7490_004833 [Penicillium lividum]